MYGKSILGGIYDIVASLNSFHFVFSAHSATVFLDDITQKGFLSPNALLLSIYPLTVGGWWCLWWRNVENHFFEYEPPNQQHGLRCVRS